jgi:hypothetical protein
MMKPESMLMLLYSMSVVEDALAARARLWNISLATLLIEEA